ncbi:MAG TPA: type III secretion system export apparatus subunit SctS [Ideonella sp.]|jgi:type III secretion protein S|uniref:type III secretion system export apparatus subunit SctS n=1 Tax=Ideonella sp. TaxID=1929293 RepID=UPI002E3327EE|nr:type III secretion system export apparatus subunit SctS [Ideonella sp.]HEX5687943.1 type III secretion system export apparatus subunit SctS [Ideonella sp.]
MGHDLLSLTRDALSVVLWVSLPLVIVSTIAGLGVAILQAVTQIQDQSIGQSVRLVVVLISLMIGVSWLGREVLRFAERAFEWMEHLK